MLQLARCMLMRLGHTLDLYKTSKLCQKEKKKREKKKKTEKGSISY